MGKTRDGCLARAKSRLIYSGGRPHSKRTGILGIELNVAERAWDRLQISISTVQYRSRRTWGPPLGLEGTDREEECIYWYIVSSGQTRFALLRCLQPDSCLHERPRHYFTSLGCHELGAMCPPHFQMLGGMRSGLREAEKEREPEVWGM